MELDQARRLSRFNQAGRYDQWGNFFLFDGETGVIYRKKKGKQISLYGGNMFKQLYRHDWRTIAPHEQKNSEESERTAD